MSIETLERRSHTRPRITLTAEDYERLSALAQAAMSRSPELAAGLADEIGRARVLAKGRYPQQIVCMNSEVQFRDDRTGKVQTLKLVYPAEADIGLGRLSVLTPVGTALIGVRVGESVTWETPSGDLRQLTILAVRDPIANSE